MPKANPVESIDLQINPDELTIGDLEDFEDFVGKPIGDAVKPVPVLDADGNKVLDAKGRPEMTTQVSAKALRALVWIVARKTNSAFTLEDARNVKVSSLVMTDGLSRDAEGND